MRIAVCAKQVPDPETPPSQFKVDEEARRVVPPPGVPPVVNGFDLHAVEAAIQIKERVGGDSEVTVFSVGTGFVMDVMKKPLSMGADRLVLVDDPSLADIDAYATVRMLSAAIGREGDFDLILCGRQASDWDQSQVPLGLAEILKLPCLTLARTIDTTDAGVRVERVITDGYQVIESPLPAVITVSNEYGEPRYPTLRGIMAATRKQPVVYSPGDLDIPADGLAPAFRLTRLFVPESERSVEMIDGETGAEAGRNLAVRLREEKLI